jgi:hypothetical protein
MMERASQARFGAARRKLLVLALAGAGAGLWASAPQAGAAGPRAPRPPIAFEDAKILIELNATDEDVGMQVFLDGEGWRKVKISDPDGRKIFDVKTKGSVGKTGVTELFFESEEPSLAELPLEEFLARFPEGEYEFEGVTIEGEEIEGVAMLTHAIPDGPVLVAPAEGAVVDPDATFVDWEAVADPPGSSIVEYEVIVERADVLRVFDVHVPAAATRVAVPPEFLEAGKPYKFEVLAIEAGGNQTLSESFFETAE